MLPACGRRWSALPAGSTVFVDEAQNVPSVFDAVQHLYDADPRRWRFVLCGSSTRKLRKAGANLLPGRSVLHRLFPLILAERLGSGPSLGVSGPAPIESAADREVRFPQADLLTRLAFGELPGVVTAAIDDRAPLLNAYAVLHLEEEIRRESLGRDWGAFTRFMRLAASESGGMVNYAAVSRDGAEIDPVIERGQMLTPVEVKWTEHPDRTDARHALKYLAEHPNRTGRGWIVCRCERPMEIADRVTAIPWRML